MACLKKAWKELVFKHYSWSSLPQEYLLNSDFSNILDQLTELTGVRISKIPAFSLTETSLSLLKTSSSV